MDVSVSNTLRGVTLADWSAAGRRSSVAEAVEGADVRTDARGVAAEDAGISARSGQTKDGQASGPRMAEKFDAAELEKIRALQKRDREVRQHEMAHLAASGGLAISGATYSFRRGPDGVFYAVGGEVNIDTSPGRTPQETMQRAETIIRAATAPAEPSAQDRAVAAKARQMVMQAGAEHAEQLAVQREMAGANGDKSREPAREHPGIRLYRQTAEQGGQGEDLRARNAGSIHIAA